MWLKQQMLLRIVVFSCLWYVDLQIGNPQHQIETTVRILLESKYRQQSLISSGQFYHTTSIVKIL